MGNGTSVPVSQEERLRTIGTPVDATLFLPVVRVQSVTCFAYAMSVLWPGKCYDRLRKPTGAGGEDGDESSRGSEIRSRRRHCTWHGRRWGWKARYRAGRLGDVEVKRRLTDALNRFLDPIRAHRAEYEWAPGQVNAILAAGADRARPIAHETLRRVYEAMGLE